MKTLKEFMSTRKYVAVIYDDESQKKLREWCIANGFDLSKNYNDEEQKPEDFEFHTTIIYSTNETMLKNGVKSVNPTEVSVDHIKFLGVDNDIPVLAISSPRIEDIRKHYESLGLEDAWDSYIPHISISYAKEQKDVSSIKMPEFRPKFDKIIIKDLKI